jgi:hypothetical protein
LKQIDPELNERFMEFPVEGEYMECNPLASKGAAKHLADVRYQRGELNKEEKDYHDAKEVGGKFWRKFRKNNPEICDRIEKEREAAKVSFAQKIRNKIAEKVVGDLSLPCNPNYPLASYPHPNAITLTQQQLALDVVRAICAQSELVLQRFMSRRLSAGVYGLERATFGVHQNSSKQEWLISGRPPEFLEQLEDIRDARLVGPNVDDERFLKI